LAAILGALNMHSPLAFPDALAYNSPSDKAHAEDAI
jgi:hypothetical protein